MTGGSQTGGARRRPDARPRERFGMDRFALGRSRARSAVHKT